MRLSAFLVLAIVPPATVWAEPGMLLRVYVVRADSDAWAAQHAADELARYVHDMTGVAVCFVPETPALEAGDAAFELSLGAGAEDLQARSGADEPGRLRDGFVIRSQGGGRLRIAATQPIGLLYGIYEYLEAYCGVGFFWDGDYVPERSSLPVDSVDVAVLPRWPVRHFGLATGWGLVKWHHHLRPPAARRQIFDWMAKRKINRTHHDFGPTIAKSGISAQSVFGISDAEPDNFTFAGWPGCLDWPAEIRTRLLEEQFAYSRQRGITWAYYLAYGNLPHQFRQTHPEYNYVDHLGYSATVLYPHDPECTRWTKAFYENVIATYGTDHLYQDTPFVESAGAADLEESFQLKLAAAKAMCGLFKELDPEAVWQSDSWDFGAQAAVWTPERIQRYFHELPQDMMLFYDTAGIANPFYKRTNYFEGTPWTFGILHSFQGDDHLHGGLEQAVRVLQELSADPKADQCQGVYHVPESSGHNILFFDLTTHLAWRADGVTIQTFLDDFTRRRYGDGDFDRMRRAVDAMARGVHGLDDSGGGGQMPIYQKLGCPYGPHEWWPIVDERPAGHPAENASGIHELREAVETALACRRSQQDNALYVNDLVDWARTYLAHVFNRAVIQAYKAFGQGDAGAVTAHVARARDCLEHIEAILSTRPDFSLHAQIDWAMQVPGANPYLPWYMKQHCINDLYCANEVYEQLHWYYGPRIEVYFAELEQRAAQGVTTIAWGDIADRCNAIQARWLDERIAVPEQEKFAGTTVEAVLRAFEATAPPAS